MRALTVTSLRGDLPWTNCEFDGLFSHQLAMEADPIIELLIAECYSVNEFSLIRLD
jgi:hypothetical protein